MGPIPPSERTVVVIARSDDDLTLRRSIAPVMACSSFEGPGVIMETVTTGANADRVLQEQIGYYRARATEYDQWFLRLGRYDHGEVATRRWFEQVNQVRAALATVALDGAEVLELAPGTGIWTAEICARAKHVTAVDASPEMMDLNRQRLGADAERV